MLVTVGIPCFNSCGTLPDAIRSVVAQTIEEWELIIVDDGSTDQTPELLARLDDPRVRIIRDGENRGLSARLNQIASMAGGRLLARLDADDMMFPNRLSGQLRHLEAHPNCTLVGSAVVCIDGQAVPQRLRRTPGRVETPEKILGSTPVFHPTVLGRTEWFRAHPYDEACTVTQDFDLWARNAAELKIRNLPDPLLFYREYAGYTWRKYRRQSRATRRIIRREGPSVIGRVETAQLLAIRAAKDAVYAVLAATGCWRLALHLRNKSITKQDVEHYHRIIAAIRHQTVPGWEEHTDELGRQD